MKRLRYLLLSAALVVGLSALSVAQDNDAAGRRDGRKHRRDNAGKLAEKLGLTDAQRTQLQSINQAHKEQVRAIAQNQSLTEEQKREQLRALNQQHQDQVQGLLTPEQQQEFRKIRERRKEHRGDVRDRRKDRREEMRDRRQDGQARPPGQRRFR